MSGQKFRWIPPLGILGTLGALAVGLAGCGERPSGVPDSLLLIVIDTLRADRLGCFGYELASTPSLDSLAASGVRFRRASTPVPTTLPAIASLLTGRYPMRHRIRDNGWFALAEEQETLAERFRAAGFRTGAVVASAVVAADRGLDQGFERYDAEFRGPYAVFDPSLKSLAGELAATRRRADGVTDRAIEMIRGLGKDRFFLLVHYFDVHMHYDPPPEFARLHPGRPYDGEVSFVDRQIGRLLAEVPAGTQVVVVSDHGESQGEHGEPQHGFLLYESTLHVPVIVAGPSIPAGLVRDDPISLVDLEPTIARTFGLSEPAHARDGRALSWTEPEAEVVPLYAEAFHPLISYGWSELRSLRVGDRKLIHGPPTELYDLGRDPDELDDRGTVDSGADLLRALEAMIEGNDDPEEVRASARGAVDAQSRELLEALGYVGREGSGEEPAPRARPHPRDELPRWVGRQEAKEHVRRAAYLLSEDRTEETLAWVDSALTADPDCADAHFLRGVVRQRQGGEDRAREDYRAALDREPAHVETLGALARIAETEGRTGEAMDLWSRVATQSPDHAEALRFLSLAHLDGESPELALPYLRRLVAQDSSDVVARYNLGLAAYLAGDHEEATRNLRAFLDLAPGDPEAAEVRGWLEEMATPAEPEGRGP